MHERYSLSFADRLVVEFILLVLTAMRFSHDVQRWIQALRVRLSRAYGRADLRAVPVVAGVSGLRSADLGLEHPALKARRCGVAELEIDDEAAWAEYTGHGILTEQEIRR